MMGGLKPYPRMKDSGVAWLGEVPEHWSTERTKWLFRKMDRPVKESDEVVTCFRDGIVTLRKNRRVRGFTESLKEIGYQGIRRGDLVIHAMDAFAGAIGVADADGKGTPVYSVCEPRPMANSHYYAYAVREMARSQWIQALAKGIRERSTDFRFEEFGSQLVPLPPQAEQTAIVRFLDHADRRIRRYIRAKQKLIKLLEEQKQAIIHQAVTGRIDVRTGQPYPAYKDSGVEWLGDVPAHWEVKKLRQCGSILGGLTPSMADRSLWDGDVPWVTPKDMKRFTIEGASMNVATRALEATSLRLIPSGSVLLVVRGMILARRVPIARTVQPVTINQDMKAIVPAADIDAGYLAYRMDSAQAAFVPMIDEAGHGTKRFPTERWKDIVFAIPPVTEQRQIVNHLDEVTAQLAGAADNAQREISLLHEYRTRLIADVVTGKLDVREAAARLPAEDDDLPPDAADDDSAPDELADDLDAVPEDAEA
ncbi:MAG TPA: restriction endonuclease subunit S [Candidatus Acidoferrales bacterium]|nr:restriction endonuclease subunit S [Candidatus Acidoferrales bacterium]